MHPIYRVIGFKIFAPYTLHLQFDDGTFQTIDFKPILKGEIYGPLLDLEVFNQRESRSRSTHPGLAQWR